jgi:nitroreductase / dihydropteridine reductase
MEFRDAIKWRYATKRMNGKQIAQSKIDSIIEAITLAPTSMGMQPFSLFSISDEATKNVIAEKACGQPQIKESSHLLVLATWNDYPENKIDEYLALAAATRSQPIESFAGFKTGIQGFMATMNESEMRTWAQKQAYIALGFGLIAAAMEEVDATPMEGFKPNELDSALDLESKGMHSCVILALGYRDEENDYLVNAKKVRRDLLVS